MKRVLTIISAFLLTCCFAAEAYAQTDWTAAQSAGGSLQGNFILRSDVTLKSTIYIQNGTSLTIDLNGHTITFPKDKGRVCLCYGGGELTIKDSSPGKTGVITGGKGDRGGFIYLIGKFNFLGGTIKNAHAVKGDEGYNYENAFTNGVGGAVYVQAEAEFIMDGGNIEDCSAYGHTWSNDFDTYVNGKYYSDIGWMPHMGGAVFINAYTDGRRGKFHFKSGTIKNCFSGAGGAVCVHVAQSSSAAAGSAGEFIMDGGKIIDCKCDYLYNNYNYGGGAVFVAGKNNLAAKFIMYGGTISGCTSATHGGGIKTNGIVEMHGGTITDCHCTIASHGQNFGGGVHLFRKAKFTMTGGTISNCTASSGGGVMVWGDDTNGKPTFIMDGDPATTQITGCRVEKGNGNGGAVYVQGSTFNFKNGTLSGNKAWRYGGAININETAFLTLEGNCIIRGNVAGAGGGISQEAGGCVIDINSDGVLIEGNSAIFVQENKDKLESTKTACGQGGGILLEKGDFSMSAGIIQENYASLNGGGVSCYVSRIPGNIIATIAGGKIFRNEAGISGGGIDLYADKERGDYGKNIVKVNLTGGILESNSAKNGGGIYVGINSDNSTAEMTISSSYTESTIRNNIATGNGGAIGLNHGTVTVNSGNFFNNTAEYGGAIYLGEGNMSMNNIYIHGNTATKGGGGVYLANGTLTIEDADKNKIIKNTATSTGGGILVKDGNLKMETCLVQENIADYGGGVGVSNSAATTINLLNPAIDFEKNTAYTAGGGMAVLGPITLNFAGSLQHNTAGNGGGIFVAQGAKLIYKGGMIRYNHATGTSTGINTGHEGTANGIHGFGGGVFVGSDSKLEFNVTEGGFGFYSNDANTGGDDIFANGKGTDVLLPVVGGMELTGFNIPVATDGIFWVEDYMTKDVKYNLGPQVFGSSHSPIRYRDALKSAAVIGRLNDVATYYETIRFGYLSLALGYELLFVRIVKQGLDPGDAAIVNVSYSTTGEISGSEWVQHQKALLVGPESGDASVIVALPPNAWKFEEETAWSENYTATNATQTIKFENQIQVDEKGPVTFENTKKAKSEITVHDEDNVENRMIPTI